MWLIDRWESRWLIRTWKGGTSRPDILAVVLGNYIFYSVTCGTEHLDVWSQIEVAFPVNLFLIPPTKAEECIQKVLVAYNSAPRPPIVSIPTGLLYVNTLTPSLLISLFFLLLLLFLFVVPIKTVKIIIWYIYLNHSFSSVTLPSITWLAIVSPSFPNSNITLPLTISILEYEFAIITHHFHILYYCKQQLHTWQARHKSCCCHCCSSFPPLFSRLPILTRYSTHTNTFLLYYEEREAVTGESERNRKDLFPELGSKEKYFFKHKEWMERGERTEPETEQEEEEERVEIVRRVAFKLVYFQSVNFCIHFPSFGSPVKDNQSASLI